MADSAVDPFEFDEGEYQHIQELLTFWSHFVKIFLDRTRRVRPNSMVLQERRCILLQAAECGPSTREWKKSLRKKMQGPQLSAQRKQEGILLSKKALLFVDF